MSNSRNKPVPARVNAARQSVLGVRPLASSIEKILLLCADAKIHETIVCIIAVLMVNNAPVRNLYAHHHHDDPMAQAFSEAGDIDANSRCGSGVNHAPTMPSAPSPHVSNILKVAQRAILSPSHLPRLRIVVETFPKELQGRQRLDFVYNAATNAISFKTHEVMGFEVSGHETLQRLCPAPI